LLNPFFWSVNPIQIQSQSKYFWKKIEVQDSKYLMAKFYDETMEFPALASLLEHDALQNYNFLLK